MCVGINCMRRVPARQNTVRGFGAAPGELGPGHEAGVGNGLIPKALCPAASSVSALS